MSDPPAVAQADVQRDAASQAQRGATVAPPTRYLALLRGINVGGKNIIKMADLKACLEAAGFVDVATYIQSGNVLLTSADGVRRLTERLERLLSEEFAYRSRVVMCSQSQLRRIVSSAPAGFGEEPSAYRYDVLFLKEPLTSAKAVKEVMVNDGVDAAFPGPGVIYFSRLEQRATQSRLGRLASLPVYQYMTVRNWNTTTKLLALMDARRP